MRGFPMHIRVFGHSLAAPRFAALATAFVCAALLNRIVWADEPEWSAGAASVKITPEKPVPLAGYAFRTKPHEKVDQDIFAKVLALKDRQGNRAVLVTFDGCVL